MQLNAIETTNIIEACNIIERCMRQTCAELTPGWDKLYSVLRYLEKTYQSN